MTYFQTWQLTGNLSSSLLTNTDESSFYSLASLFLSLIKICESVVRNFVDNREILSVVWKCHGLFYIYLVGRASRYNSC